MTVRALLQRVLRAEVRVADATIAVIGPGLVVLLGVGRDDEDGTAAALARRVAELRIFEDDAGRMNRSLLEVNGSALVVSQFTLYADTRHGRRPSFTDAAPPERAERLWQSFCRHLAEAGVPVARGRFGAKMEVELVNDGPVTLWLDTDR